MSKLVKLASVSLGIDINPEAALREHERKLKFLRDVLSAEELSQYGKAKKNLRRGVGAAALLLALGGGLGGGLAGYTAGGTEGGAVGGSIGALLLPLLGAATAGIAYGKGRDKVSYSKPTVDDLKAKIAEMSAGFIQGSNPYKHGELDAITRALQPIYYDKNSSANS